MKTYKITLNDQTFSFDCDQDDTILRAALRSKLGFSYECNSGGCGACKFELIEGETSCLWDNAPGLSARDLKKGKKLACQSVPTRDCTIKTLIDKHFVPEIRPKKISAELYEINELTQDMSEFHFKTNSEALFSPGQFALIDFPGVQGSRAYSMSNLPNEFGHWSFIIKRKPSGHATSILFDVIKIGDQVTLDTPYGLAFLDPDINRDIVLIGGGSGLSPMLSIAKSAAIEPKLMNKKIYLFYGGRTPSDICTPRLLLSDDNLKNRIINHNAISDPDSVIKDNWTGECCYIHELVEKVLDSKLTDYEYYFCGPPPMTDAITRMLMMEHKVSFDQIHYDRFF